MSRRKYLIIAFPLGILLAFAVAATWYLHRVQNETALMKPDEGGEAYPSVYAARQQYVNSWFVKGSGGWIAVDCGIGPKALAEAMRKMAIPPTAVKGVLLTHSDYDHAGGIAALEGAPIYIGDQEEQMVDGRTARAAIIRNKGLPPHRLLSDGEKITLAGLDIVAYSLPGHTPGTTAYLIGDGLLFVGDAISIKDGGMAPFNDFFNMNSKQALASQEKLRAVPGVKAVFTGHYGHSIDPVRLFAVNQ